jgi:hypothetical protein
MDDEMRAAFADLEALMTAKHKQLIEQLDGVLEAIAQQRQQARELARNLKAMADLFRSNGVSNEAARMQREAERWQAVAYELAGKPPPIAAPAAQAGRGRRPRATGSRR